MKKLFLVLLGGTPQGRNVEQHDVLFTVGETIEDTFEAMRAHWAFETHQDGYKLHMDSYMPVDFVDGYKVRISENPNEVNPDVKLFFINLGGYKENDLEEYHKKLVIAANSLYEAKEKAKEDRFFSEGMEAVGAVTHVDDKMPVRGFDVDEAFLVDDHVAPHYHIVLEPDLEARFSDNEKFPSYRPLY